MTGYYLLDHPNRTQQYRHPRRARLSGMVGVHTTEGVMDSVGPDTGAENVASFIAGRADYGSYHRIVDSDGTVVMAPDDYETWHIGADAHNWHAWGISAACRSTDWNPGDDWTRTVIARMGAEIRDFWERNGFDPVRCARWLTRSQALAHEAGLIHHGVAQPSDRSDAWVLHPQRATLDRMLIDAIVGATPPEPEDIMATKDELREVVSALISEQDARIAATIGQKVDAILVNVDPVGVAAGTPGQGPSYLRTEVGAILALEWVGSEQGVDAGALAAHIADKLGPDLAAQVVDELGKRLG